MNQSEPSRTLRLPTDEAPVGAQADPQASVRALPAGTTLHEYRILSVLGSGGFGMTYLAQDLNLDCKVAIKEFFPPSLVTRTRDQAVHPQASAWCGPFRTGLKQFMAEARTLASFRHPNIVRVRRFFETNGTAYMVMEYEEGESLFRWVTGRGCPDRRTVLEIVMQLLNGLEAVHAAGFLHLDMKPSNIVIRPDGSSVLLDFGAARRLTTDGGRLITTILTPGYAPYEQYHDEGRLGPWNDLYSLGAVMYYMVTGRKPVDAPARITTDPLLPATAAANLKEYGAGLLTAIDWALDPDDQRRPQHVAEFRNALLDDDPSLTGGFAAPARAPFDQAPPGTLEAPLARHVGQQAKGVMSGAARTAPHLGERCRTPERTAPERESQRTFRLTTLRLRMKAAGEKPGSRPAVWPPPYQVEPSSGKGPLKDRA
ncbi:MAG: serine/threonine protein kinase [Nitrospirae bacterium]|nr:MAG: serine/threonine protein kinase [Nitrospirota bacterium]